MHCSFAQRTILLAASVVFAATVTVASHYSSSRHENLPYIADHQLAILASRPFVDSTGAAGDMPEMRSRILVPLLMQSLRQVVPVSPSTAFVIVRASTAFLMFVLVGTIASTRTRGHAIPLSAMGLVAILLLISFNHPLEFPTDFPDIAMAVIFVEAARRQAHLATLLTVLIGVGFRESAAFGGVIWWCCSKEPLRRRAAWAILFVGAAILATLVLRLTFRLDGARVVNGLGIVGGVRMIAHTFGDSYGVSRWTAGLLLNLVLLGGWLRAAGRWWSVDVAPLRAAAVMLAITIILGSIHELRIYMPIIGTVLMAGLPDHAARADTAHNRAGTGETRR